MIFEIRRARRGRMIRNQYRVTIVAENGESLFVSETYNNYDDAYAAASLVKRDAGFAEIHDLR